MGRFFTRGGLVPTSRESNADLSFSGEQRKTKLDQSQSYALPAFPRSAALSHAPLYAIVLLIWPLRQQFESQARLRTVLRHRPGHWTGEVWSGVPLPYARIACNLKPCTESALVALAPGLHHNKRPQTSMRCCSPRRLDSKSKHMLLAVSLVSP